MVSRSRLGVFAAILIGLLGGCCSAAAEERWSRLADEVFRNYGADDGLPHPVVAALAQDGDGFLWVGTQGGLARWDGYRFRNYLADPSDPAALPNNYIQFLTTDRRGRLWVGTASGQLARYDREKDGFAVFQTGEDGKGHVPVDALAEDGDGGIWVGTEGGLDHWDKAGAVRHLQHDDNDPGSLPGNRVYALLIDRSGAMWLGTDHGLARYRADTGEFVSFDLPESGAPRPEIYALMEDGAGRLWVGTRSHGAFMIDADRTKVRAIRRETASPLDTDWVMTIAEVQDEIWMGSSVSGIIAVDSASLKTRWITHDPARPTSLPYAMVRAVLRDRSGVVWVGGPGWLSRYVAQNAVTTWLTNAGRPDGISDRDVVSVHEVSPDRVWVGTVGGGVNILDPLRGRVGSLPTSLVLAMASNGGHVYLTGRDMYRADADGGNLAQISLSVAPETHATVRALLSDGDAIWCASDTAGVLKLDPRTGVAERVVGRDQLTDQWATVLLPGPDDGLWVGTRNGLDLVDRKTGKVEMIYADPKDPGSLSVGFVSTLLTDRRGRLWVGTLGGGINVMEGRDGHGRPRFRHIGKAQGLPVDNIGKLVMDPDGRVWASTSDGIAVIDPETLAARALRRAEGVSVPAYWTGSGTATSEGEILFGGQGGLTIIHPGRFVPWAFHPPVAVSELRIGGKRVPPASPSLTIPAEANSLAVEFAALDLSAPERNRYAYKLEGYDKDWVETDWVHRLASYTNLPPGGYTLRLRGSNRDGEWSEKTLDLPVRVLPLWHQTLWFKGAAAVGPLLLVLLLLRSRTAYLRRRQTALEQEVAEQTAELRNYNETLSQLGVIGQQITATLDTEAVFETVQTRLGTVLDAPVLTIFLLEADGVLVRRFGISFGDALPQTRIPLDHPSSNVALAARGLRMLTVELKTEDEDPNHVPGTPKTLSRLFAPLMVHRRLLGVMSVQTATPHAYGEREKTIFSALCSYVSIAIDNTHAYGRVSHSLEQVASLLDNSGEGFLSFGADLVVEPECSRACETMLGASPAGRKVDEVLFPDDEPGRELLRATVARVLAVGDSGRGRVMLSLLPSVIEHGGGVLKIDYKQLDAGRFMVVLDDITEERRLAEAVDEEHRRLSMIVWAVTENRAFLGAVDEFLRFLSRDPQTLSELYREVHTFKGVLAQFSFQETPRALHRLERGLSDLAERGEVPAAGALAAMMRAADLEAALQTDLAEIEEALGEDFLHRGERVVLPAEQAAKLRDAAERILRGEQLNAASADFRALLEDLRHLRKITLKDALAGYGRVVIQAAAGLEKEVAPVEVTGGGDLWVDPDVHGPFLRSLVHVFRNAVAHGIEEPDIRLAAGKEAAGHIRCDAEKIGEGMRFTISDDGAGIDIAALRAKLAIPADRPDRDVLDLIFEDGVSTRKQADDLAGHGVGLAAVKAEITKLGGRVSVRSTPGRGTEFSFVLPII